MDQIDDKTVLLTGAKQADEMQVIWSKADVVRAIAGKTKIVPPEKAYSLKVIEGADRGKVFPLERKERFCIGRSGGDLVIKDPKISKVHCVIEFYDGIVVIKDMNSTNGTLLNQMVLAEDFIKDGDRLQVGNTTLLFQGNK
ncbi:MAG: FHA domain-containing protein [Nitrospirae bacterium]|nr:FHA domain-containing protein [Nitrospirota bacterium]